MDGRDPSIAASQDAQEQEAGIDKRTRTQTKALFRACVLRGSANSGATQDDSCV